MQIPISEVITGKRMRQIGDVSELADSIQEIGLLNPITITKDRRLIAGERRLEACRKLGWTHIQVTEVDLKELDKELAEIDENLIRSQLTELEESLQLARRKEIYEIKHPQTKQGATGRKGSGNGVKVKSSENGIMPFSEDTAAKTGKSRTVVERKAKIGKKLKQKAAKIKGTKIEDSQKDLLALAKMDEPEQDAVIEKIQSGQAKNVKEAKQEIRKDAKKVTEPTALNEDQCRLVHADIGDVSQHITDASLDFIITDPPYPREYLPVYETLAKMAARTLKPGGSLLVMIGQSYLPEILALMTPHIRYHWTLAYLTPGGQAVQLWQREVNTFWKPVLWFVNGEYGGDWIGDVCKSSTNDNDKRFHSWGQSESGMADLIERFTYPGQLICDPFLGGGTTGAVAVKLARRFIGMDISAEAVNTARVRIAEMLNG